MTFRLTATTKYGHEYASVRLGSGYVESFMILLGIGALLYGLKNSIKGDAKSANSGAKFAVGLSVFGAVMFVWDYGDATDWWLGEGFYGAFIGGLTAVYAGKKTIVYSR